MDLLLYAPLLLAQPVGCLLCPWAETPVGLPPPPKSIALAPATRRHVKTVCCRKKPLFVLSANLSRARLNVSIHTCIHTLTCEHARTHTHTHGYALAHMGTNIRIEKKVPSYANVSLAASPFRWRLLFLFWNASSKYSNSMSVTVIDMLDILLNFVTRFWSA